MRVRIYSRDCTARGLSARFITGNDFTSIVATIPARALKYLQNFLRCQSVILSMRSCPHRPSICQQRTKVDQPNRRNPFGKTTAPSCGAQGAGAGPGDSSNESRATRMARSASNRAIHKIRVIPNLGVAERDTRARLRQTNERNGAVPEAAASLPFFERETDTGERTSTKRLATARGRKTSIKPTPVPLFNPESSAV